MVNPVPDGAVEIAKQYKNIHFYEEHVENGGVAQRLGIKLLEDGFTFKYRCHCVKNYVIKQATVPQLWKLCGLDYESIINDIKGE